MAKPIEALAGPTAAFAGQVDPTIRPPEALAAQSVMPDEARSGPIDLSTTSAILTARPAEALAARPTAASTILVEGLAGPIDATARLVARKLQLRRPDARDDPELEELVSIAVACARRAEDAVQQAREISGMARRRMSAAAVTGAGVLLAASAVGILGRNYPAGEPAQPITASAFLAAPVTADPAPLGSVAPADAASIPARGRVSEPAKLADRLPVPDVTRAVTDVSPPTDVSRPVPLTVAAATPPPPVSPAVTAPSSAAALPPPVSPPAATPLAVAAAVPPSVSQAMPTQVPVAASVPPRAKEAEPAPSRVAEARAPMPSPNPAPPSTGRSGNPSAGVPAGSTLVATTQPTESASVGQPTGETASLDAPPLQAPPAQALRPVRHTRRIVRRVIYYPPGPGLLLAQVVYGVRRNLYEIFH